MTAASEPPDRRSVAEVLHGERRRLEELLADVVGSVELDRPEHGSAGGELSTQDQHPAEDATETEYREQSLSEASELRARISEVDAALRRLDDGTYGVCQACGRPIGRERLEALPATPFCVDDARSAEAEAEHPAAGGPPSGVGPA